MNTKTRTTRVKFLIAVFVIAATLLSACGADQPAPATPECPPFDSQTGWGLSSQSADGGCNYAPAGNPTNTVVPPVEQNAASTPMPQVAAPASGIDTSAYEGTAACEDGKNTTPLFFEKPSDVPWGTKEGATVAEIAWKPGTGFAGWYRIIAIAERILDVEMPYANSILTLYVTQYCGSLQAIKDWAPTHATAIMNSSQNSAGDRPDLNEIPVVLLKRDGSIEWVKEVSNGPSIDEIRAHLEIRP